MALVHPKYELNLGRAFEEGRCYLAVKRRLAVEPILAGATSAFQLMIPVVCQVNTWKNINGRRQHAIEQELSSEKKKPSE